MNYAFMTPTSELDAVNCILSGIGEAPINSLSDTTNDVTVARHILMEVSKDMQLEGFQWNMEDNYPLMASAPPGEQTLPEITLPPQAVRIQFREPSDRELTLRGNRVYDRINHTFTFPAGTVILVTLTLMLPFEEMPEAARRYATLKALRVFQERVLGSQVLSQFQAQDEARARAALMADERKQDQPNILTGTHAPVGTWQVADALRRGRRC